MGSQSAQPKHARPNTSSKLPDCTEFGIAHDLHKHSQDDTEIDTVTSKFPHAPNFQSQWRSMILCVLTVNCFTRYIYDRGSSMQFKVVHLWFQITILRRVAKKRLESFRSAYEISLEMCWKEIRVRLKYWKMVSVDAKKHRSRNKCKILYRLCRAQKFINKWSHTENITNS